MIYKSTLIKTAKQVHYNDGELAIKIKFPYSPEIVKQVKTIPGRRYEPNKKYWHCSLSIEAVEKLKKFEFQLDNELKEYYQKFQKNKISIDKLPEIEIPGLKMELFPFQKQGVSFIEKCNGRTLIADEMGLGKTAQALAWLQLHPELRPAVIVVPASLKLNWAKEINMWMGEQYVCIANGINMTLDRKYLLSNPKMPFGEILIINYDILYSWKESIKKTNPKVLILDECHYIKNNKAKRTKAVKSLAKKIPHILALSGTPITNRPIEIYNVIKLIDSTIVGNFWQFTEYYCDAKHNGYGWDFTGASHTDELHEKLSNTIMIRRKKQDVLRDLPEKIRSFVPIELENEKEYQNAEINFIEWIRNNVNEAAAERASNAAQLTEIETLKQIAVKGKLKGIINWIDDFLESGEKLIIFALHKFIIDTLIKIYKNKAVKIDGSVSIINRQQAVDLFQNDKNIKLFIGNMQAAGTGITLTSASNVLIIEFPWTPGELDQGEDRPHRIGQKNAVNIYYPIAKNTIEERIAELLDKKRKVLDSVLNGKITEQESLLMELIKQYKS
jgi:SWI/SNF-related matrix-associated actin-dependent regulator 1 of chromatin subfamily A